MLQLVGKDYKLQFCQPSRLLMGNVVSVVQCTGLVRHVFRLLRTAIDSHRPVPWVLLENVSMAQTPSTMSQRFGMLAQQNKSMPVIIIQGKC